MARGIYGGAGYVGPERQLHRHALYHHPTRDIVVVDGLGRPASFHPRAYAPARWLRGDQHSPTARYAPLSRSSPGTPSCSQPAEPRTAPPVIHAGALPGAGPQRGHGMPHQPPFCSSSSTSGLTTRRSRQSRARFARSQQPPHSGSGTRVRSTCPLPAPYAPESPRPVRHRLPRCPRGARSRPKLRLRFSAAQRSRVCSNSSGLTPRWPAVCSRSRSKSNCGKRSAQGPRRPLLVPQRSAAEQWPPRAGCEWRR